MCEDLDARTERALWAGDVKNFMAYRKKRHCVSEAEVLAMGRLYVAIMVLKSPLIRVGSLLIFRHVAACFLGVEDEEVTDSSFSSIFSDTAMAVPSFYSELIRTHGQTHVCSVLKMRSPCKRDIDAMLEWLLVHMCTGNVTMEIVENAKAVLVHFYHDTIEAHKHLLRAAE